MFNTLFEVEQEELYTRDDSNLDQSKLNELEDMAENV
jgi:hypothetical protein